MCPEGVQLQLRKLHAFKLRDGEEKLPSGAPYVSSALSRSDELSPRSCLASTQALYAA